MAHLCGYVSEEYLDCDRFLAHALERLMRSNRKNILFQAKVTIEDELDVLNSMRRCKS